MARTPNPKLHALWHDRVRRQEASGLTIAQFCAQECVARSKFYAWKQRFRLMTSQDDCPTLPVRTAFLPVTVQPVTLVPEQPLLIEADLPNGIQLRIPTANARLASRLVRTLAGATTVSGGAR
jgi:hypothetical protein